MKGKCSFLAMDARYKGKCKCLYLMFMFTLGHNL